MKKYKAELSNLLASGIEQVDRVNPMFMEILGREYKRQNSVLMMVASCGYVYPGVLACMGMPTVNVTSEGYPNKRYHAGCEEIDKIEEYAIKTAKEIFKANYANVQPHSATTANEIVTYSLVKPGGKIMGMRLNSGGHLSHGASVSYSGTDFNVIRYGLDKDYMINYDEVEKLALRHHPEMIICGTTAYCREINFKRFRKIADKVGAYLLADISHISGLIIAELHQSPIDYAHITTTCTHKQLFGPRGGLILLGKDADMLVKGENITLKDKMQRAVFPFFQGAPMNNMIGAKAFAFEMAKTEYYKQIMRKIVEDAKVLAVALQKEGLKIVSNGTDNHIVLIDLSNKGISGDIAEKALEECGIIVNKNTVPNTFLRKNYSAVKPAGIRIGMNSLAQRNMTKEAIEGCAILISEVLNHTRGKSIDKYEIDTSIKNKVLKQVEELCVKYPIPNYII